jgi:hypothetical protein
MQYSYTAIIIPENQVAEKCRQACNILAKLRYYRQRFEKDHDAETKRRMKEWEQKADIFIEALETEPDPHFFTAEKPVSNEPGK